MSCIRWRATYCTDAGKLYPFVSLEATDLFLPTIFRDNAVRGAGFCSLPQNFRPRQVILWDVQGEEYKIEYPFRSATPEWLEFWREIKANPLVMSSKGFGEIRGVK
jgi:hypothetical protein